MLRKFIEYLSKISFYDVNLQNTWDDLHKYVKRNVKRTLDERIERRRAQVKVNGNADAVDTDSDIDTKGKTYSQ